MEIGDVYTVEIPSSDGHEQAGARPAIIVQATRYGDRLQTVLIVPLTSRLTAQSFPGTFLIQPDSGNNLDVPSVALVFQLRALDRRRIRRRLGRLSPSDLSQGTRSNESAVADVMKSTPVGPNTSWFGRVVGRYEPIQLHHSR